MHSFLRIFPVLLLGSVQWACSVSVGSGSGTDEDIDYNPDVDEWDGAYVYDADEWDGAYVYDADGGLVTPVDSDVDGDDAVVDDAGIFADTQDAGTTTDAGDPDAGPDESDAGQQSGGGGGDPSEFDVTAVAQALAAASCEARVNCLGAERLTSLPDGRTCEEWFTGVFTDYDLLLLQDAIQSGFTLYEPEQLSAGCASLYSLLGCEVTTARLSDICAGAFEGTVALGDACQSHFDCLGDAYCDYGFGEDIGSCPGVCVARAAVGEACPSGEDEACVAGSICWGAVCQAPLGAGSACGTGTAPCAFGTLCIGATGAADGQCVAEAEVFVGEIDDNCSPSTQLCRADLNEGVSLVCDAVDKTCQPAVGSNQACTPNSRPDPCPLEQYCHASGQCTLREVAGIACDPSVPKNCAAGTTCFEGTCEFFSRIGETCVDSSLCYSGFCNLVSGVCEEALSCQ